MTIQFAGGCASTRDAISLPVLKQREQALKRADSRDLDLKVEIARRRSLELLKNFEASVSSAEANYVPKFAAASNSAAERGAEIESMVATVYYLAKDQAFSTVETDEYFDKSLGPILRPPIEAFGRDVDKLAAKLEADLRVITVELGSNLNAGRSAANPNAQVGLPHVTTWSEFDKVLLGLGYSSPGIALYAATNVNRIATSSVLPQLLKPISLNASRVFATLVARVVASGGLVMVGGPLPIGEILAALNLLWSTYELTQLQPRYRSEIRSSAISNFDSVRGKVSMHAREFAREKAKAFDTLQVGMRDQAVGGL